MAYPALHAVLLPLSFCIALQLATAHPKAAPTVVSPASGPLNCSARSLTTATTPVRVSSGRKTLVAGYAQDGQDFSPVWALFDGDAQVWCRSVPHASGDQRPYAIAWDTAHAQAYIFAACSGNSSNAFAQQAQEGWLTACPEGDLPQSVAVSIDLADGSPRHATFVAAQPGHGAGGWTLESAGFDTPGNLVLRGSAAAAPPDTSGDPMVCGSGSSAPFAHHVRLAPTLDSALESCATECAGSPQCGPPIAVATEEPLPEKVHAAAPADGLHSSVGSGRVGLSAAPLPTTPPSGDEVGSGSGSATPPPALSWAAWTAVGGGVLMLSAGVAVLVLWRPKKEPLTVRQLLTPNDLSYDVILSTPLTPPGDTQFYSL